MSEFDYESEGNFAWNEFDWQEYLNQNKREIRQFLALYQNAESSFNPFEAITEIDGDNPNPFEINLEESEFEIIPDPYTIHKHPLFLVAKGLAIDIAQSWEKLLTINNSSITPGISWEFAKALQDIEYHINGGIYAIDITETALAIAHFKNSLSGINEALRILNQIAAHCTKEPKQGHFSNAKTTLFNLRGAIMRIFEECREQEERYFD